MMMANNINYCTRGQMKDKQCNYCSNEDEDDTLYWDNELDYSSMVDYTCLCQTCYNKLSTDN